MPRTTSLSVSKYISNRSKECGINKKQITQMEKKTEALQLRKC